MTKEDEHAEDPEEDDLASVVVSLPTLAHADPVERAQEGNTTVADPVESAQEGNTTTTDFAEPSQEGTTSQLSPNRIIQKSK